MGSSRRIGQNALVALVALVGTTDSGCLGESSVSSSGSTSSVATRAEDGSIGTVSPWSDGGGASGCYPGYVEYGEGPTYHSATSAWQGACTSAQLQAFSAACVSSALASKGCSAFRADANNAACAACIFTNESASHYGPLIDQVTYVVANRSGCLELMDPALESCAIATQAAESCEESACQANCPVDDAASLGAYDSCAQEADLGVCLSRAQTASVCRQDSMDAGSAATCFNTDFSQFAAEIVPIFCGVRPTSPDSGTVPGEDAGEPGDASVAVDASTADGGEPLEEAGTTADGKSVGEAAGNEPDASLGLDSPTREDASAEEDGSAREAGSESGDVGLDAQEAVDAAAVSVGG